VSGVRAERLNVLMFPARYPSPARPYLAMFHREHVRATALYDDVAVLDGPREETPGLPRWYTVDEGVEDGVRVVRAAYRRSPVPNTSLLVHVAAAVAAARRLVRAGFRPHVVHAHMYFVALAAVVLGRVLRVPVLVSEHAECFAGPMPTGILREIRFALRQADLILPDSGSLRRHMEAQGIRGRFHVVHNPVDAEVFHPGASTRRRDALPRRLLFVGRLLPVKDVGTLLKAVASLRRRRRDFVLDVVGEGERRAEYEALARALGLEGVVAFLGGRPRQAVADLMRRSDVFVLSSVTENCPCVLVEALASGLPVVTTDVGGVREVVPEDMGLFVPAQAPDAFAEGIDRMLDTLDAYEPEALAASARGRFGLDVIGRDVDAQYRRLLAERR
jgi:glycosyltransferase involved in cell wall biosynthesis